MNADITRVSKTKCVAKAFAESHSTSVLDSIDELKVSIHDVTIHGLEISPYNMWIYLTKSFHLIHEAFAWYCMSKPPLFTFCGSDEII